VKLFLALLAQIIPTTLIGSTFQFSENGSLSTIEPTQSGTEYANRVITSIYDTLYEYKYLARPYELKPNLAEAMPEISKDGLTYTVKIKKNVRFADDPCFKGGKGRAVTASDIVYSVNRHFDPENTSQQRWMFEDIKEIKAVDDHTITIELKKPDPQIIYTLAHGASAVVPKEAVEKYGKEFGRHPVGSGPWILDSIVGTKIKLKKNPGYRAEKFDIYEHGYDEKAHGFTGIKQLHGQKIPVVDSVDISFIDQPSARWLSFTKNSQIQYTVLSPDQSKNILASKKPVTLNKEFAAKYNFAPITDL